MLVSYGLHTHTLACSHPHTLKHYTKSCHHMHSHLTALMTLTKHCHTSHMPRPLTHLTLTPPPPSVVGFPGNYHRIGAIRLEECSTYGCFLELTIQLVIILGGKQILYQAMELGLPLLKWILNLTKNYFRRDREKDPVYARWERDYDLGPQPKFGLLPEYLELAVQYGFVTLFVASFPLAPLFAFVNNVFEVRLDAYKYVVATRRPVPKRAEDIGAWYGIFNVVATLAVVTNVS